MTFSEENYLKSIYHLGKDGDKSVSTNAIAEMMETKASSVTDMLKKLSEKGLVSYKKYQGARLTKEGKRLAIRLVRKHRLWECFLVDKLNFTWDEVHEVAEQLEHIKSEKLTEQLDSFLGFPRKDPHGDPIPDKDGNLQKINKIKLSSCKEDQEGIMVGVNDSSKEFLQYLDKMELSLGSKIRVFSVEPFDNSMRINAGSKIINISEQVASNIFIEKI